jgi:fumarate hydratase, class II
MGASVTERRTLGQLASRGRQDLDPRARSVNARSMAKATRTEKDSLGEIEVDADRLWGAQTERSLRHFRISEERMPRALLLALARIKRAAASVNATLGELDAEKAVAIVHAADELLGGRHADEFPLVVWQTGSGTQTNMNMNEVLANRASELLGGGRGDARRVHPNDDVNRGQSSNDTFPAALAMAATEVVSRELLPALDALASALELRAERWRHLIKIGRTHLMDATPLTLGQEVSGWAAQLRHAERHLSTTLPHLGELALGGTAVGTGLNAHPEFGARVAALLALETGLLLSSAPNKFEALAAHDAAVAAHGALKGLAVALHKIANDVRWLGSGPRAGLAELRLPENEPGSSIMPGKVNPTQCEALTMVAARVLGNDVTISFAGALGAFELNVYKPVIAQAFLQSARLLTDAMRSFLEHCVADLQPDEARLRELVDRSLMLVTALAPTLGYDAAARIAKHAHARGLSLREATLELGLATGEDFDRWVRPEAMLGAGGDA